MIFSEEFTRGEEGFDRLRSFGAGAWLMYESSECDVLPGHADVGNEGGASSNETRSEPWPSNVVAVSPEPSMSTLAPTSSVAHVTLLVLMVRRKFAHGDCWPL